MKKLFFAISLFFLSKLSALPLGNPADPSLLTDGIIYMGGEKFGFCHEDFSFRAGFYGDYVYNRHAKVEFLGRDREFGRFQIFTNAGYFVFNIWNKLDLFATLGASNISVQLNGGIFGPSPGRQISSESSTCFSWSVGSRLALYEICSTVLGVEAQYFDMRPHIYRSTIGSLTSVYDVTNTHYKEWQFGAGIAHKIDHFAPYIGAKWSNVHFFDSIPGPIRNKKKFGYAIGVSIIACLKASLGVEVRLADEKALFVNGQIRF